MDRNRHHTCKEFSSSEKVKKNLETKKEKNSIAASHVKKAGFQIKLLEFHEILKVYVLELSMHKLRKT